MVAEIIDLTEFAPADRFGIWHDIVARSTAPQVTSTEHRHNFNAEATILDLGEGVTVISFRYPSLSSKRGPRQISQGDPEVWQLALPVAGADSVVEQAVDRHPTQTRLGRARHFTVTDSSRPWIASHRGQHPGMLARAITMVIPRGHIPLREDRVARIAGARMPATAGMGRLLVVHLTHIVDNWQEFRAGNADTLRQVGVALAAETIAETLAERLPDEIAHRALRHRIDSFIDAHLENPELGPKIIAAAHNVSIRQVHRLFEGGRSVMEEIRIRRLEACARDLVDPALADETVVQIATRHGIRAHLSRPFREQYGVTPTEYRHRCRPSTWPEPDR